MKTRDALIVLLCITSALSLVLSLMDINVTDFFVENPPVIVNGSDGQRKDIFVGGNIVIVFSDEVKHSGSGYVLDSGYGIIYAVAGQLAATPDELYEEVHWTLVCEKAGWLVYASRGY